VWLAQTRDSPACRKPRRGRTFLRATLSSPAPLPSLQPDNTFNSRVSPSTIMQNLTCLRAALVAMDPDCIYRPPQRRKFSAAGGRNDCQTLTPHKRVEDSDVVGPDVLLSGWASWRMPLSASYAPGLRVDLPPTDKKYRCFAGCSLIPEAL
jgi:hypothetical protein